LVDKSRRLPVDGQEKATLGSLPPSELALRERNVGFIVLEQRTFPLVSSVEDLKFDLADGYR
jgi:hypothetical protein